jgi:hypothetical protein
MSRKNDTNTESVEFQGFQVSHLSSCLNRVSENMKFFEPSLIFKNLLMRGLNYRSALSGATRLARVHSFIREHGIESFFVLEFGSQASTYHII